MIALHVTARFRIGARQAGQAQFIMPLSASATIEEAQAAALIEARERIAKERGELPLLVFVDGMAVTFTTGAPSPGLPLEDDPHAVTNP